MKLSFKPFACQPPCNSRSHLFSLHPIIKTYTKFHREKFSQAVYKLENIAPDQHARDGKIFVKLFRLEDINTVVAFHDSFGSRKRNEIK